MDGSKGGTRSARTRRPLVECPNILHVVDAAGNSISIHRRGLLGRGAFATVYEAQHGRDGSLLALKVVDHSLISKPEGLDKLQAEIALHGQLTHSHIVRCLGHFQDDRNIYLVLEHCTGVTVDDIVKQQGHLTEEQAAEILLQVLPAIQYLHRRLILHRDLKLSNLLLDQQHRVKISDFGLAVQLSAGDQRRNSLCGTPNYIAPEVLEQAEAGHGSEVDVWAVGVMLYTMLVGQPPFHADSLQETYKRIQATDFSLPGHMSLSEDASSLISSILRACPEERPSLAAIYKHPFLRRYRKRAAGSSPELGCVDLGSSDGEDASSSLTASYEPPMTTPAAAWEVELLDRARSPSPGPITPSFGSRGPYFFGLTAGTSPSPVPGTCSSPADDCSQDQDHQQQQQVVPGQQQARDGKQAPAGGTSSSRCSSPMAVSFAAGPVESSQEGSAAGSQPLLYIASPCSSLLQSPSNLQHLQQHGMTPGVSAASSPLVPCVGSPVSVSVTPSLLTGPLSSPLHHLPQPQLPGSGRGVSWQARLPMHQQHALRQAAVGGEGMSTPVSSPASISWVLPRHPHRLPGSGPGTVATSSSGGSWLGVTGEASSPDVAQESDQQQQQAGSSSAAAASLQPQQHHHQQQQQRLLSAGLVASLKAPRSRCGDARCTDEELCPQCAAHDQKMWHSYGITAAASCTHAAYAPAAGVPGVVGVEVSGPSSHLLSQMAAAPSSAGLPGKRGDQVQESLLAASQKQAASAAAPSAAASAAALLDQLLQPPPQPPQQQQPPTLRVFGQGLRRSVSPPPQQQLPQQQLQLQPSLRAFGPGLLRSVSLPSQSSAGTVAASSSGGSSPMEPLLAPHHVRHTTGRHSPGSAVQLTPSAWLESPGRHQRRMVQLGACPSPAPPNMPPSHQAIHAANARRRTFTSASPAPPSPTASAAVSAACGWRASAGQLGGLPGHGHHQHSLSVPGVLVGGSPHRRNIHHLHLHPHPPSHHAPSCAAGPQPAAAAAAAPAGATGDSSASSSSGFGTMPPIFKDIKGKIDDGGPSSVHPSAGAGISMASCGAAAGTLVLFNNSMMSVSQSGPSVQGAESLASLGDMQAGHPLLPAAHRTTSGGAVALPAAAAVRPVLADVHEQAVHKQQQQQPQVPAPGPPLFASCSGGSSSSIQGLHISTTAPQTPRWAGSVLEGERSILRASPAPPAQGKPVGASPAVARRTYTQIGTAASPRAGAGLYGSPLLTHPTMQQQQQPWFRPGPPGSARPPSHAWGGKLQGGIHGTASPGAMATSGVPVEEQVYTPEGLCLLSHTAHVPPPAFTRAHGLHPAGAPGASGASTEGAAEAAAALDEVCAEYTRSRDQLSPFSVQLAEQAAAIAFNQGGGLAEPAGTARLEQMIFNLCDRGKALPLSMGITGVSAMGAPSLGPHATHPPDLGPGGWPGVGAAVATAWPAPGPAISLQQLAVANVVAAAAERAVPDAAQHAGAAPASSGSAGAAGSRAGAAGSSGSAGAAGAGAATSQAALQQPGPSAGAGAAGSSGYAGAAGAGAATSQVALQQPGPSAGAGAAGSSGYAGAAGAGAAMLQAARQQPGPSTAPPTASSSTAPSSSSSTAAAAVGSTGTSPQGNTTSSGAAVPCPPPQGLPVCRSPCIRRLLEHCVDPGSPEQVPHNG